MSVLDYQVDVLGQAVEVLRMESECTRYTSPPWYNPRVDRCSGSTQSLSKTQSPFISHYKPLQELVAFSSVAHGSSVAIPAAVRVARVGAPVVSVTRIYANVCTPRFPVIRGIACSTSMSNGYMKAKKEVAHSTAFHTSTNTGPGCPHCGQYNLGYGTIDKRCCNRIRTVQC